MPCGRQNVPPAAFITTRNLWRLKLWGKAKNKASLGVLVLSYPWLDWFHPDRLGAQLRRLLPFLKAMLAEAKRDSPHCTVGVMIDFLCLPQKPFATEEDGTRFGVSLKAINAWYFHQYTYTLLVTNPPPEGADYSNTRLHRDRGWCFFEQAASMVVKDSHAACSTLAPTRAPPSSAMGGRTGHLPRADEGGPHAADRARRLRRADARARGVATRSRSPRTRTWSSSSASTRRASSRPSTASPPSPMGARCLYFRKLGWGDAEAAELRLALQYAAAKCAFPEGAVRVMSRMATPSPRRRWRRCRLAASATSGRGPSTGARRATRGTRGRASSLRSDA